MGESADRHHRLAPNQSTTAVAALFLFECGHDGVRVAIPRPEIQLVARFGPPARDGLDIHVMGARSSVHRKLLRVGQRSVTARLRLGTAAAALGISASALAENVVALEDLWGESTTRLLRERLAGTRDPAKAAAILEQAVSERAGDAERCAPARLAVEAADRLMSASVKRVAADLGVSERHLRRVFRETVGLGPKTFVKLTRFHRALSAARTTDVPSWARIAAAAGYYDQAHLIAEFKAIACVTPRVFLAEVRANASHPLDIAHPTTRSL